MVSRESDFAPERPPDVSVFAEMIVLASIVGAALAIESTGLAVPLTNDRDCQCASIAANLVADGPAGLFYPRVNFGGDGPGHLLLEFPLVSGLGAMLLALFPSASDAILRVPSMAFSALAILALFDLTRRRAGSVAALFAAALFAFFPLQLESAASPKPDLAGLALSIGSLAMLDRYLDSGRAMTGLASAALFAFATLGKTSYVALIVAPWGWIVARRGARALLRPSVLAASALALLPIVAWSIHAVRVNAESMLWPDRSALDAARQHMSQSGRLHLYLSPNWYATLVRRFAENVTVPGATLAAAGFLAVCAATRDRRWVVAWAAGVAMIVVVFPKHSQVIPYYTISAIPLAAFVAGAGVSAFARRLHPRSPAGPIAAAAIAAALVPLLGIPRAVERIGNVSTRKLEFGASGRRIVPPGDLLIVSASRIAAWDGSLHYLCGRFGWKFPSRYIDESNPDDALAMRRRRESRFNDGLPFDSLPVGFSRHEMLEASRLEDLRARGARWFGYFGPPDRWVSEQKDLVRHVLSRYPAVEVARDRIFVDLSRQIDLASADVATSGIVAWQATESASGSRTWRAVDARAAGSAFAGFLQASAFEPGTVLLEARSSGAPAPIRR